MIIISLILEDVQGEEEGDYSKKYKMTSEDRTDWGAARAKQREEREKQEWEKKAMELLRYESE